MTQLYGVIGWPIAHSRSPAMHNAAYAALGLDALYVPLAIPEPRLPALIAALRALGLSGINVTLPHKTAIMPLLDVIEPAAAAIGAVNTVYRQGNVLVGTNTDAAGLARSLLAASVQLKDAAVVVLGTSGAARAAVVGLAEAGARSIVVAGRRPEVAQTLAGSLADHCRSTALSSCDLGAGLHAAFGTCSLLIQATSATLGDTPDARAFAASLPIDALPNDAVVCDLVYKPLQTAVMQRASERGLRTVDGLGMLLHQGALAFERWLGQAAPIAAMRNALLGK